MKAILMTATGSQDVLQIQEIDEPQIQRDTQLKVRLKAAGVNPIDTKLRKRGVFYPNALPAILGCDGSGVVVAAGNKVTRFKLGDEVWFCNGGLGGDQGNYAEYTLVDETVAQPKPTSLSFTEAAGAPLILITAWEALYDRAQLNQSQTVLIHGGAGGVGHMAIQLAKLKGARVFATVGSDDKAAFVKSLGADEAICYHERDFVDAVNELTHGLGVDVALDSVGGETLKKTFSALSHYGTLVTLLDPGADIDWREARTRNLCIGLELMLTPMLQDLPKAREHHGEILQRGGQWFDEGHLKIAVKQIFPLEEATKAHALIEKGHTYGKVVLTVADD